MNEDKIEDIKDSIRQLMQLFTQRDKPLSEQMKIQLFLVLKHAQNRIDTLRKGEEEQETIQASEPKTNQIPIAPHPSSNVYGFQYDPGSEKLLVKFMGKDTANSGPIYSYEGVPNYIFDILRRGSVAPKTSGSNRWHTWKEGVTPSHGASMYALIKAGGFPYQKVA